MSKALPSDAAKLAMEDLERTRLPESDPQYLAPSTWFSVHAARVSMQLEEAGKKLDAAYGVIDTMTKALAMSSDRKRRIQQATRLFREAMAGRSVSVRARDRAAWTLVRSVESEVGLGSARDRETIRSASTLAKQALSSVARDAKGTPFEAATKFLGDELKSIAARHGVSLDDDDDEPETEGKPN